MTFQSNAERFEKARELGRIKEQRELDDYKLKFAPYGGDFRDQYSCYNCEFRDGIKCTNKAASLMGNRLDMNGIRLDNGLCGPDGVFWAQDSKPAKKRRKKRVATITGIISVGMLLSAAIMMFGIKATLMGLGLLLFFILVLFCG